MALKTDLEASIKDLFATKWERRDGRKVPEPEDVRLGNDAVAIEAACLYADLANSTMLVNGYKDWFAAEVYKTYLHCATKLIRDSGGTITSFDGDRVMGVFFGDKKRTTAVKCAMKINYAVRTIINPALAKEYTDTPYRLQQAVGVDVSKLFVARTGIRNNNDLVWVGRAANYAAKLSALRVNGVSTWITPEIYKDMHDEVKFGGNPKVDMWKRYKWSQMNDIPIYGSNYWWAIE